ncbi:hypothetical protein HT031_002876 [Scenedesmus sp. PABB004]|nr:hypothetical protein HT031_002876 [Scenedesmus sp. PABB004]
MLLCERQLLCEQLEVSPDSANLCQAVQKVLAAAKRARALEAQTRLLARGHRDVLLQLEAEREEARRAADHWRACEQAYRAALLAAGAAQPELPPAPAVAAAAAAAAAAGAAASAPAPVSPGSLASSAAAAATAAAADAPASSGGSCASGSMAVYAALLQRLGSGSGLLPADVGSPSCHLLLPPTPPASDLACRAPPLAMRRSHSLDSGLNSLTGLLDQLALGALGSDSDELERCDSERDSWMLVDALSDEPPPPHACPGGAAGGASKAAQHTHRQGHGQLLPVAEGAEDSQERSDDQQPVAGHALSAA